MTLLQAVGLASLAALLAAAFEGMWTVAFPAAALLAVVAVLLRLQRAGAEPEGARSRRGDHRGSDSGGGTWTSTSSSKCGSSGRGHDDSDGCGDGGGDGGGGGD